MAGPGKPTSETEVVLTSDGQAVFKVFQQVDKQLADINAKVAKIGEISNLSAEKFQKAMGAVTKDLRDAMSQMNTLAKAGNTPGTGIQALNANRSLAKQTREATEYAQSVKMARDGVEGLRGKINDLNREIAGRGAQGQGATVAQRDRLALYEKQLAALKALGAQAEQNERRISRAKGGDLSAELKAVEAAQARLNAAAKNPARVGLVNEIKGAQQAQDALTEAVARTRREQAALLREQRAQRMELAGRDVRSLTANGSLSSVQSGLQFQRQLAENRLAGATGAEIAPAREALKLAEARVRAISAMVREQGKLVGEQVKSVNLAERENRRRQGALANREVRDLLNSGQGSQTVLSGMMFQRELAENRLMGARTPDQVAAAREALAVAERRVKIAESVVRAEEKAAAIQQRAHAAQQRADEARDKSAQNRLRMQEAENTRARWVGSREGLVGEAAKIRELAQAEAMRLVTAQNIARIRAQMLTAGPAEVRNLQQQLMTEKAIEQQLSRNIREKQRELREQEKLNAASSKQATAASAGSKSPSILPAGGFGTVFARTAAYGAAGTVLFGIISGLRQGAQFAVEFEDKLKTLQAVANATDIEMKGLQSAIEGVGATSRYSLVELTETATKLAQAGVSAGSMGESLKSVSQLATASGSTTAESVDLITAALGSFQLQADETPRIADMITSALNRTRLTVQQAALAIQYVGATAYEQNIGLEQLLATAAALSQAGIRSGSTIGTGMRQFLVDLQNPSEKLMKAFEGLNITAADVDVTVRGLSPVLETLNKAGFGAAQAYGSLETRAAAFYLVARNNTALMDELQMSFAEQGATAIANERAMDSLSAQWQRFQNILGTSVASGLETPMRMLKDLIKLLSDSMDESQQAMDALAERRAGGFSGYTKRDGGLSGTYNFFEENGEQIAQDMILDFQKNLMNMVDGAWWMGEKGWGTRWREYSAGVGEASTATEQLTARMNVQAEATNKAQDTVNSLDHEISRLVLQQDSLKGNTNAVNIETVNLQSRFENLSKYINSTSGDIKGLIGALRDLRNEEAGALLDSVNQQISLAEQAKASGRSDATAQADLLRSKRQVFALLNPNEKQAVSDATSEDINVRRNAVADLRSARQRWEREKRFDFAQALTPLINAINTINTSEGTVRLGEMRAGSLEFQTSRFGAAANKRLSDAEGKAGQIRSADAPTRERLLRQMETILAPLENMLKDNIKYKIDVPNMTQTLERLVSIRTGARASAAPPKPDKPAATPVERGRMISEADILRIAQVVEPGIRTNGSERRSRENQNRMFRNGQTTANADTSYHTRNDGVAKDLPGSWGKARGQALAAQMNERAKAEGLKIFYKWESGEGKNQGTGEHIHGYAMKNQRVTPGGDTRAIAAERRQDISTGKLGLNRNTDELALSLRKMGDATTEDVFNTNRDAAKAAYISWEKSFRDVTEEEIVAGGMGANAAADRRREMENTIAQKRAEIEDKVQRKAEQFQEGMLDTIMKTLDNQLDAAQLAFEAAMKPSGDKLARVQAQAEGLGFASNLGRVPDYVQQLADRRIADAQEAQARVRSATLPSLISDRQSALFEANTKMAITDWSKLPQEKLDEAKNKIAALAAEVANLRTEKENLDIALGAGGLVPTTLQDGLNQAIEAFRQANNVGNTFGEDLIMNMGGALTTVHEGMTTFFTDIMTGSQTVLGAFQNFVQGMIKYMIQLAARAVALKVFNLLLNAVGAGVGGAGKTDPNITTSLGSAAPGAFNVGFNGAANVNGQWVPALMGGGGRVNRGSATRDSVMAAIAKDEWVVNSRATKSVGHEFMAKLNSQGAKALESMQGAPVIVPQTPQETNIYVVKEGQKPQLGKNDILLAVHEDILSGGETKKLIHHVQRNG